MKRTVGFHKKVLQAVFGIWIFFVGTGLFFSGCADAEKGGSLAQLCQSVFPKSRLFMAVDGFDGFCTEIKQQTEAFYAEAIRRYETYIPDMEEALLAYRENKDYTVQYAAYDRYFYCDAFCLPEGTITILAKNNICQGCRMNLHCKEGDTEITRNDKDALYREILCEYYEIGDIRYFSYADSLAENAECIIPNFMCMTELDNVYGIDKEKESCTVYLQTFYDMTDFFWEAEVSGPVREYIEIDGSLYRIDRSHKALFPVNEPSCTLPTGTPASVDYIYQNFIYSQKELCQSVLYETAVSEKDVEEILPAGYKMLWNNYTVGDMDGDGILDILAVICPMLDSYAYKGSYGEDSPYRLVPEYFYQELWFFAGQPDGSYQGECLSDSIVGDDTYTLTDITAFDGGFFMEYFVGRAPFEMKLYKIVYEGGEWRLAKQFGNDSYSTPESFWIYTEDILNANEPYCVSVKDFVNERYAFLLRYSYADYGCLFVVAEETRKEHVYETLQHEIDNLFQAMEELDECHDALLESNVIFLNSRVAVVSFRFFDETEEGLDVFRYLPVSIDLQTGEKIDFRDYITAGELKELLACTNPYCKTAENLTLFDCYDDYETLLKAGEDSIALCLVHEGLLVFNGKEGWPVCCLIPRIKLIDSPLAVFWDDWQ